MPNGRCIFKYVIFKSFVVSDIQNTVYMKHCDVNLQAKLSHFIDLENCHAYLWMVETFGLTQTFYHNHPKSVDCSWSFVLIHCGLVMSYGDIDLDWHWYRWWLVAWWHQAITWSNVDLSPVRFCDISGQFCNTSAINHWNCSSCSCWNKLENYITKISFKLPRGQWVNFHFIYCLAMYSINN